MSRKIQISLPSTGEDEWQATREPLMTGWLTQGPKVAAFERAIAGRFRSSSGSTGSRCRRYGGSVSCSGGGHPHRNLPAKRLSRLVSSVLEP